MVWSKEILVNSAEILTTLNYVYCMPDSVLGTELAISVVRRKCAKDCF